MALNDSRSAKGCGCLSFANSGRSAASAVLITSQCCSCLYRVCLYRVSQTPVLHCLIVKDT